MKKTLMLTVGMVAVIGLSACSTSRTTSPDSTQQGSMNNTTELQAYHWTLSRVVAGDQTAASVPITGDHKPLVLDFSSQRVSVGGLCNQLNGSYTVEGERISISSMAGTLKACTDSQLMSYERDVGQQLPTVTHWQLDSNAASPALVLTFADNSQWQMRGEPTAAILYGSEPERVFLEVAPQRVACSHPLMPNYQCLHVRDVTYDDRGLKVGTGDWGYYYDEIQGYEHQAGVRQVLRINRYTRSNPPADASSKVDILDMVVETETATQQ